MYRFEIEKICTELKEFGFLAFEKCSIAVYAQFGIDKAKQIAHWHCSSLSFCMPIATTIRHIFHFVFFFSLEEEDDEEKEKQKRNE